MTRRTKDGKAYTTLNYLWATALGLAIAIAFFISSWSKFAALYAEDMHLFWSASSLSIVTVFILIRYATATHHELNLLATYLEDTSPLRVKPRIYHAIFLLAIALGVLIGVSHLILIYGALVVAFNLIDLWSGWLVRRTITPLIRKRQSQQLSSVERNIVGAIEQYYLDNPTFERAATLMFVNWIAVSMAIVFHYTRLIWCRDLAYLVLILNTLIGEFVITLWRRNRDQQIERLETSTD